MNSINIASLRRSWRRAALATAVACGTLGVAAAHAAPDQGMQLVPGSFTADSFKADGSTETQAAAVPWVSTTNFDIDPGVDNIISGHLRDVAIKLPLGLAGYPEETPKCGRAAFTAMVLGSFGNSEPEGCPPGSQVGLVRLTLVSDAGVVTAPLPGEGGALYNLEPRPGVLAEFGFQESAVPAFITVRLDPETHGLIAESTRASQGFQVVGVKAMVWGVPADSSHDQERSACGGGSAFVYNPPCPITQKRVPFLTNPVSCELPARSSIRAASWENPLAFVDAEYTPADPISGCDQLLFTPAVKLALSTDRPDAPAGISVKLTFPQNLDPNGLGTPPLRTARVTLPEGMTINPGSADGLQACTDAQLGLKTDAPIACPDGSKIGTVTAVTPSLKNPVSGDVYIRTQASDDPESGDMFRMAIVLKDDERGLLVKLPGAVKVNKDTGRIVTEFVDNPQLPVSSIDLTLKSGPRAPLATPASCGTKTMQSSLSSWAGQSVDLASPVGIACTAGLGAFAPAFATGTTNSAAGAFAPFSLQVTKPDGQSPIDGLSMSLPAGLLAKLKGNLGTQVGTVKTYAGPGSNPFMLPGKVFLEGQYGDAPFSLKVVVPAKAGPFDLGEVVVRQKIYVDPITAQVTVVSDPVPTIVKGVPVRLQRLEVDVDKPDFIINPTSCAAKTISGTLSAAGGQTAPVSNRFQVSGCSSLALKPSLALSLSGKGQTTDGKHPAITANLTQPAGQANLKKVRVALPLSLALDVDNANGLCEFVDGSKAEPTCPKASIVGSVTATTPILDEPLTGPVYFVKNVRKDAKTGRDIKTLPKLVIPLVGQNGVKLTLTGTSAVDDDQLVTTFDNIPDAPVSSFKLNINGGKGGILVVSDADICKATQVAKQQVDGQNNKQADTDVFIQTPSCALKVLSKKVGKSSVAVKVGGLSAGKVTLTGRGIKKTTKTITKSTVATITAKRTKGTPGKVTVSFDPAGPAKARKTTR